MSKPKRQMAPRVENHGVALNKAGDAATADLYSRYELTEVPGGDTANTGTQNAAFTKARLVAESNYWLRSFLPLKQSIFNHGFTIAPAPLPGKKKSSAKGGGDLDKLNQWLDTEISPPDVEGDATNKDVGVPGGAKLTVREQIEKFVEDAWTEFLLLNNCIAFWQQDSKTAITLPPERCRYKDVMGIETLFYLHGLTENDKKLMDPEQAARFKESEIPIDFNEGEFFKVLKRTRTGFGLSWPVVQSVFRTLGTLESMEMGESSYAFSGRAHWRQHRMGHEIKQGAMAGKPAYHWTKKKGDAARKIFEDKRGFLGDLTSNFDFTTEYPHEDVAYFTEDKWKSPEHRLLHWGGPLALMLAAAEQSPFLTQLLKAEATEARKKMGAFLESVIRQAWAPPVGVKITWSNRIFADSRIAMETLTSGLSAGPISQKTWREEAGFNDAEETARKEAEATDSEANPNKYQPAFDASHGDPMAAAQAKAKAGGGKGGGPVGQPHADGNSQS